MSGDCTPSVEGDYFKVTGMHLTLVFTAVFLNLSPFLPLARTFVLHKYPLSVKEISFHLSIITVSEVCSWHF